MGLQEALLIFGGSSIFFAISYAIADVYMKNTNIKEYHAKTPNKKADFLSRIIANEHAVISTVLSVLILKTYSYNGESIFTDDDASSLPSYLQKVALLITSGYLFYDIFVCLFLMYTSAFY